MAANREIFQHADEKSPWKTFLKAVPEEMPEVLDFYHQRRIALPAIFLGS
jgi:hypothetical protein